MSKYLSASVVAELNECRKRIFAEREAIYRKHKIDVLDTDTLSALSIFEVIGQYDTDYNINFARNGEDAISQGIKIEQKCSRVVQKKRCGTYADAAFLFHAMGDLEYSRYILVTRDKTTLALVRAYDISKEDNVKIVQDYLLNERAVWEAKCKIDKKCMKRDVIGIPESVVSNLTNSTRQIINNCEVILA